MTKRTGVKAKQKRMHRQLIIKIQSILLSIWEKKEEERTQITWEISTGFQQICKYSINSQSYLHAWHYYNSAI